MAAVRVNPEMGPEIVISRNGGDPVTYQVGRNGNVEVDDADVEHFRAVTNGELVAESDSTGSKPGSGKEK